MRPLHIRHILQTAGVSVGNRDRKVGIALSEGPESGPCAVQRCYSTIVGACACVTQSMNMHVDRKGRDSREQQGALSGHLLLREQEVAARTDDAPMRRAAPTEIDRDATMLTMS